MSTNRRLFIQWWRICIHTRWFRWRIDILIITRGKKGLSRALYCCSWKIIRNHKHKNRLRPKRRFRSKQNLRLLSKLEQSYLMRIWGRMCRLRIPAERYHSTSSTSGLWIIECKPWLYRQGKEATLQIWRGKIPMNYTHHHPHFHLKLQVTAYVFDIHVPPLLVFDVLTNDRFILYFGDDSMISKPDACSIPLLPNGGHFRKEWPFGVYFTNLELREINRRCHHLRWWKLYVLTRRADPKGTSPKILDNLDKITSTWEFCKRKSAAPQWFRVYTLNQDCTFNCTDSMDLMRSKDMTIIQIADKDTKISTAFILKHKSTSNVWNASMNF